MRAAVLTALNAPLELHDVEPLPLTFGQVRVRMLAAGICGAQLQEIRGEKGGPLPHLMGHEGCGIVEEIGPAVTRVAVGDKVICHWRRASGIESPFPRYRFASLSNLKSQISNPDHSFTSGLVTTWAEQTVCSENRLTPVPADTPRELCALLGCGLSTALATIERDAALKPGERVLVIGCGGLGVNLIRAASLAHAGEIYATDILYEKSDTALALGASRFFCGTYPTKSLACDCIIDTVGAPGAIAAAFRHLGPSGRYILLGQPAPGVAVTLPAARQLFDGEGQTFRASQGGGFLPDRDIPRYLQLWRTGALKIDGIITHRFPLAEINTALALVRTGSAGRIILTFD
jgi:Zn-dependent alcohol dehydrogenase